MEHLSNCYLHLRTGVSNRSADVAFGLRRLCFYPTTQSALIGTEGVRRRPAWGMAALTSPIVLATIGVVTLWIVFWARVDRVRLASFLVAGAAITIVPWMVRDFYVYGRLVPIEPRAIEHLPNRPAYEQGTSDKIEGILNHPD